MGQFMIYFAWFSVICFFLGSFIKLLKVNNMPLHLRVELYPVAHDPKYSYGGSYMEDANYVEEVKKGLKHIWTNDIIEILREVLFLKRVKEYNIYGLWFPSLLLHWGLYLLFGWILLSVFSVFWPFYFLIQLSSIFGIVAGAFGLLGSFILILRRIFSQELRIYTTPLDFFNLFLLLFLFLATFSTFLFDANHDILKYLGSVISFKPVNISNFVIVQFFLFQFFLFYFPFSKFMHAPIKYWTWHSIMWDDALNLKGEKIDLIIQEQLKYKQFWSASHAIPGASWAEVATNLKVGERSNNNGNKKTAI
ncbi:Nitrate reductase gamma subunit [Thermodesulfobium acidiphilum]|uniref:Nitrate reductase gamma subunit n=1 Tax=Thermodesulfobium acidiphilum TaxID=1794699 RepID=A0A2R4W1F5_THEAF|nr:respiratory nitrate reductase subunit gamma [Thermodesulfobium acidiphilum]AWB10641.1 Nitrate reductase gamma subunit [Thermodesulfobium acidiphilum]